jgi:hypothetical protein
MKGSDYVAVKTLWTREGLVAAPGERCDRVPVSSLPWLLEQGKIAPAEPTTKKAKAKT